MQRIIQRTITSSALCSQAMKAGTPIPGLNFLKGKDAPVAMERSEYPDWVGELEKSQIALAKLRRMEEADASDSDKMRYLKLTRRALIKENNLEAGAKPSSKFDCDSEKSSDCCIFSWLRLDLSATFVAALRSVGTAGTMAMAGFYLHRRGYINAEGNKALARLSQQVTIPALFFSKIMYCPQDFSHDKCPDITENLGDVWVLLLWPLFVVGCGLFVGEMVARWSNTPPRQRKSVIAACAFSNSTGLPITLLTVVHANFPATSELGRVDPNLFLSVYLLLYPVLQWGIGGWLLATGEDDDEEIDPALSHRSAVVHHVLNVPEAQNQSTAEAATRMIRELSLSDLLEARAKSSTSSNASTETSTSSETTSLFQQTLEAGMHHNSSALANPAHDMAPLVETIAKVLSKALQPPVIGALLGLIIASITPLRGLFVDLDTRSSNAPLEWLFDGIHSVGLAAVPINMAILGINLSLTLQTKKGDDVVAIVSRATIVAIVIGKMIVMPAIGIVSALILKNYVWNIPEDIAAPFYLVLMIVTITPTANNVMVMVELSGSGAKEGMARIIGWQYACAPILLSITVMLVVRVAVLW